MTLQELAYALELEGEQYQAERAREMEYEARYAIPLSIEEWACYRRAMADNIYGESREDEL